MLFTTVVGAGLSCVSPVVQRLISDNYEEASRGAVFGLLGFSGALTGLVTSSIALEISNTMVCPAPTKQVLLHA